MGARIKAVLTACALLIATQGMAAEPVPVSAFSNTNKIYAPRLSPDGKHLAVSADFGEGNHALLIYNVENMQQTAMLRLPRYEMPARTYWVSDKRLIVAKGRQIGSREEPASMGEIIATDFDGKNQKYVYGYQQTTRTAGIDPGYGAIVGFPEQPNGRFYMRRLSYETKRSQLYEVDAERTTARLVADIPVKDLDFVLDRQGVPRYATGTDDDNNYLLYAADAQGTNWQEVPGKKMGGKFMPYAFSADGTQLYAGLSKDGGPTMLVKSDPDGQNQKVLAQDEFGSVGALEWTARPVQPFAATLGEGMPRMIYFDPQSPEAQLHQQLNKSFPGKYVTYVNHSTDGNISLLYVYSDRDPGAWYLFNRQTRKVSKLLASREGLEIARMGERRPIRFKTSDGLELDGFLTLPAGVTSPQKLPMVLLPHGGPHGITDEWAFDTDAQFLASRGYLVLQVNYRGSGGRGYEFERAGHRRWGTRIQDDLLDGVRWSIAQGYTDPARICVYGASFGAYSAMMTAARAPELFKCAIGLSGVYDLKMMFTRGDINDTRWGRNYLTRVLGSDDAVLAENSPVTLASKIQAPVLLIHGEVDDRTPFSQAKAMKASLERAGRTPEWMAVPKEGHGFYKDENNLALYQRLESFLGRHLGTPTVQ